MSDARERGDSLGKSIRDCPDRRVRGVDREQRIAALGQPDGGLVVQLGFGTTAATPASNRPVRACWWMVARGTATRSACVPKVPFTTCPAGVKGTFGTVNLDPPMFLPLVLTFEMDET